jgi:hypothetical protein
MIDFTTLSLIAVVLVSLVAGHAALFGDTLFVAISVPPKLVEIGFTEATAEHTFVAEAARITHVLSAFPTPDLAISSQPTVLSAIAKPLGMEAVGNALQTEIGISNLSVQGAVLATPGSSRLDLTLMVTETGEAPEEVRLTQQDGDAITLIQRGADLALEQISPYRVALANYAKGVQGDLAALAHCRETVTRDLAQPWNPAEASERSMEQNLLALLALLDGDLPKAQQQLLAIHPTRDDIHPTARAIINLNRAFVAVALKQPAQAKDYFQRAAQTTDTLSVKDIGPRVDVVHALVLWSNGDLAGAEQLLHKAVTIRPDDEGAHTYLGRLLAATGNTAGAAAEQVAAATSHHYDPHIMDLAQSVAWVDPVNGGIQRRY